MAKAAKVAGKRGAAASGRRKRAPAKGAAVATARKSAAAKKPAARKPAPRKAAAAKAPVRKAAPRRAKVSSIEPRKRHEFHIQQSQGEADFHNEGMRKYAWYRDLGLAKATNGMAQAHVIRMIPPCTDEVRKTHYHDTKLQFAYILKGWLKLDIAGKGEVVAKAGALFVLPQRQVHTVLDYSDDCELVEVILPADFATVNV